MSKPGRLSRGRRQFVISAWSIVDVLQVEKSPFSVEIPLELSSDVKPVAADASLISSFHKYRTILALILAIPHFSYPLPVHTCLPEGVELRGSEVVDSLSRELRCSVQDASCNGVDRYRFQKRSSLLFRSANDFCINRPKAHPRLLDRRTIDGFLFLSRQHGR